MFFNVSFHDFTIEFERLLLSKLIGKLSVLGLHNVSLERLCLSNDVSDAVILFLTLELRLL